jgi:hypothetical protein
MNVEGSIDSITGEVDCGPGELTEGDGLERGCTIIICGQQFHGFVTLLSK